MDRKGSLVDTIAAALELTYLSDMRQEKFYPYLYYYISKCEQDDFSERDWAELYCYLSGKKFKDVELKSGYYRLLNYLLNKK